MCDPDNSSGTRTIDGAKLTFNTVKTDSEKYKKTSTTYEAPLQARFGICKKPCGNKYQYFDEYELRDIERWLTSKTYRKFQPCDEEFDDIIFYGSFTQISYERYGEQIYKLVVTFETDSPYAYSKERTSKFTIDEEYGTFHIINNSDEIGYISPFLLEIKTKKAGDLVISNSLDEDNLAIKNCQINETIKIDNENQILSTDVSGHKIYDDFNYSYLRLFKNETSGDNELSFSLPCEVVIKYQFSKKVPILCQ